MTRVEFEAHELHGDGGLRKTRFGFRGTEEGGWQILREGMPHAEVGPGYRLLETRACGICSTDLDRRFPRRFESTRDHHRDSDARRGLDFDRLKVSGQRTAAQQLPLPHRSRRQVSRVEIMHRLPLCAGRSAETQQHQTNQQ